MSVYEVNRLCRDAFRDAGFRQQLLDDPAAALALRDLTEQERSALLAGDVGQLYRMGVLAFLLSYVPRFTLFGVDLDEFGRRMRAEA
ncbi:MAG TPA: hypothetical protein VGE11_22560 [Pseudonocardia sp.]